ncbi:ankyrin 2,3/unc44 [Thraustotheca clavata]|uniref:Ankyrin 2,3/unc44 n=1 Tax=Thraustotheca clavata TaxID=74557 RepID=A0A1V9YYG0_9STRA|nr:ankyrin 2,3/unc44 [Thraustotheca clavata]
MTNLAEVDALQVLLAKELYLEHASPLYVACTEGHVDKVREMLVDASTNVQWQTPDEGWTPLHIASAMGYDEIVVLLLDHGVTVDALGHDNVTPLMAASIQGQLSTLCLLVEKGHANVNAVTTDGTTALHGAVHNHHLPCVDALLKYGADVNAVDSQGISALEIASSAGDLEMIQVFNEKASSPLNLLTTAADGTTAMHAAALHGHSDIIVWLIEMQCPVDIPNEMGLTPLYLAAQEGFDAIVQILLDEKADANHISNVDGFTPVMIASQMGHVSVVQMLHENGANISYQSPDGWDAMYVAVQNGHESVLAYLATNSASATKSYLNGINLLYTAAQEGHLDCVLYLLDHVHVDVDTPQEMGWTPLHIAVLHNQAAIAACLLEHGADINAVENEMGGTPLHVAAEMGNKAMVQFLVEKGAHVSAKLKDGSTPLDTAKSSGYESELGPLLS